MTNSLYNYLDFPETNYRLFCNIVVTNIAELISPFTSPNPAKNENN